MSISVLLSLKSKFDRGTNASREQKVALLREIFTKDVPSLGVDSSWTSLMEEALSSLESVEEGSITNDDDDGLRGTPISDSYFNMKVVFQCEDC